MEINVAEIMEMEKPIKIGENDSTAEFTFSMVPERESFVKAQKPNTWSAIQRLDVINGMINELNERVNSANVGAVGQSWVDAYENLHQAMQICRTEEIKIIK